MLTIKSFTAQFNRSLPKFACILLLLVALSGCQQRWNSNLVVGFLGQPHTVAQLKGSDRLPRNVKIQGVVTDLAPMLNQGAYRIEDDTGAVWVFTEAPLPQLGENLAIRGELNFQSIEVESAEAGQYYLVEYERNRND